MLAMMLLTTTLLADAPVTSIGATIGGAHSEPIASGTSSAETYLTLGFFISHRPYWLWSQVPMLDLVGELFSGTEPFALGGGQQSIPLKAVMFGARYIYDPLNVGIGVHAGFKVIGDDLIGGPISTRSFVVRPLLTWTPRLFDNGFPALGLMAYLELNLPFSSAPTFGGGAMLTVGYEWG